MHPGVWLFVGGSVFLLYALVGYPLFLALAARRAAPAVRGVFHPVPVTVLLPVHNGAQWIASKLDSLLRMDYPQELIDIIVLSDGSTDATASIVSGYADRNVRLMELPKGGKAAALNRGLQAATGEIIFFTDVRQQLDPGCLRHLVTAFSDPGIGAVCGELVIVDGETQEEASVGVYWRLEKWIRRQLSATGSLLVVTGCVYAVRRRLAEPLPADALGDDIYMPQAVLRKGARVVFEPAARAYDYPTALDVEFGRKVRTLAGLYQYLTRRGLGPRPFHFFSYKVSRLLLPYALLLIALGTMFLPAPLSYVVAAGQIAIYLLALSDVHIPERSVVKRLSSPARTFCTLMWASVCAISVLFVPAAGLWKTTHVRQPKPPSV